MTQSTTTMVNQDGFVSSLTSDIGTDTDGLVKKLLKRDIIVGSLLDQPTEVVSASSLTESTTTLVKQDETATSMTDSPMIIHDKNGDRYLAKRCYVSICYVK